MPGNSYHRFSPVLLFVLVIALVLSGVRDAAAQNSITGFVFRDFNANGVRDTNEPGVGGVTVTAYGAGGVVGTTTTDTALATQGNYTLPISGSDPLVRVEFTYETLTFLESGVVGSSSPSSVQFVAPGGVATFGVQDPSQYCNDNPQIATTCYIFGDQLNGINSGGTAVLEFPYASGTVTDPASSAPQPGGAALNGAYTQRGLARDVGATYGMAYQRSSNTLFVGAFTKRHVGYGPTGNPGTIYAINRTTGAISVFVTLNAGADPHTAVNTLPINAGELPYFEDFTAFPAVGFSGLADVEMAADEQSIFAVNLASNQLQQINIANPASIASFAIPAAPGCPGVSRPGALKVYDGLLYVGVTCTGPTVNDLTAVVYTFNGSSFNGPVASVPLTYTRGFGSIVTGQCPAGCAPAEWLPWTNNLNEILIYTPPAGFGDQQQYRPQPWLMDIEIDEFGFMIMSVGDRTGHQLGNDKAAAGPVEGLSAGDTLRLSPRVGLTGWDLENNASVGVGIPGGGSSAGAGGGQGPGGGEFYHEDRYSGGAGGHDEVHLGGAGLVYGRGEIISASMDPAANGNPRSGGVTMSSNFTGERTRSIEIYEVDDPGTFGKAAGIGDIEVLCEAAPIEIGNRVWLDVDLDGVQDANEAPIPGVEVQLFSPTGGLLGTTTTDANGNYLFSAASSGAAGGALYGVNGLTPNTTGYEVRIALAQTALGGLTPATPNNDGSAGGDLRDSDGVPGVGVVVAAFDTGRAGANNHTYDFGFNGAAVGNLSLGNRVWFDTDNSGHQNGAEVGVDNVTVELYLDSNGDGVPDGAAIATTTTIGGGYYLFDNLAPGTYIVGIPASNFNGAAPLVGFLSSTGTLQEALPNSDGDVNDNGLDSPTPATTGILSGPVILTSGGEPIGETDIGPQGSGSATNPNSNLTVDFGFNQPATNTLSLGNRVWIDSDNSGDQNGSEVGVANVRMSLYRDDNNDQIPDGAAIATTTTNGSGYYLFTNLAEGRYIVGVDASNFAPGSALFGALSSTGPAQEANPDDDGDLNDNGIDNPNPINGGILSRTMTLSIGGEPGNEPDSTSGSGGAPDLNSNLTMDFGFSPPTAQSPTATPSGSSGGGAVGTPAPGQAVAGATTSSPGLSKSVDRPFAAPGDTVVWTVTVSNPTSATLSSLTVQDDVPSQLEIVSAGGGSVSGQTVTWTVSSLAPGQAQVFTITTRVRAGVAGVAAENVVIMNGALRARATATVVIASGLPQTGESPLWRLALLAGLFAAAAGVGGRVLARRRNTA
jgi:uncharacterized repeat protein (TIGR01451 family)